MHIEYKIASVDSVIIYFCDTISKENAHKVQYNYGLLKKLKNTGIIDITPSYTSILIHYDLNLYNYNSICDYLKEQIITEVESREEKGRLVEIPVYYDEEVGFDLRRIAKHSSLDIKEVIELHKSVIYNVYTIGFLPGFAYLGEVDKKIATPRLETPRSKVPKGSLGIAEYQSAIYPIQSPGGWNIIGRTYLDMFDKQIDGFSYLGVGDNVKFISINRDEFLKHGGVI